MLEQVQAAAVASALDALDTVRPWLKEADDLLRRRRIKRNSAAPVMSQSQSSDTGEMSFALNFGTGDAAGSRARK